MNRVVVTGMGIVTALGSGVEETWRNLIAGRSGVRPVTVFDVSTCRCRTAAAVGALPVPEDWLGPKRTRHLDRASRMVLVAGREALGQAQLARDSRQATLDTFLVLGTTGGGMVSGEQFHRRLLAGKTTAGSARLVKNYASEQQALDLREAFRLEGPILLTANACATGANAVGYAFHLVRSGQCDMVLCGGYDALSELIFAGFDSLQAMTTTTCRPFDRARDGLVLGEGAAVLVLESSARAKKRGAAILGEVAGYGQAIDTHHLTQPHPEGDGAVLAMERAIFSAGLTVAGIDHVNAHGTATIQNDAMEARAIRRCFGPRTDEIPVTSVKAALGHTLGGAGAIETVVSLLSLQHQCVPPTLNYETPDPSCAVCVSTRAKPHPVRAVLSNSFGFGGSNAAVVVRRWGDGVME
jgi:3-oxoacyl-[acyl-carrier-protein] synthase II